MRYSFTSFKNYHAQGRSWGRFFSGPFTDIHCPQLKQIFFFLLFDQNLPAFWGCICLGSLAKNTLPSFTEITLPVAQPEAMALLLNLPARWEWIIHLLFSKITMPSAAAEADFFLTLLQTFIACSRSRFFLFAFWLEFTWLLSLHFSQLLCKKYPAWLYRNYPTCGPTWGYSFFPKFTCPLRVNYLLVFFFFSKLPCPDYTQIESIWSI